MKALVAMLVLAGSAVAGPLPSPNADFPARDMGQVALGRLLFFDPVISGNRNIACASCHNPRFGTSDGLSLGLGEGASGLGPERVAGPSQRRQSRNAPALFNLGAVEVTVLFHDGRLEADPDVPGGIRTPPGVDLEPGVASLLAAQVMFPLLSAEEMAGGATENGVAEAIAAGRIGGEDGALDRIARRVEAIPGYRARFDVVIGSRPVRFADLANAMAAFVAFEWRADDSPFDRFLNGRAELPQNAGRGMDLFYGKAGCDTCHSGLFQTDHGFHAIAMPQIGPGKADRYDIHARDEGRFRVTRDVGEAFAFRTPSLRNVAQSGPYGHDGAYATLAAVVRHHLDPVAAQRSYDPSQAVLPDLPGADDFRPIRQSADVEAIAQANSLEPQALSEGEIADLIAFLHALTDPAGAQGRLGAPESVPSGLPVGY